MPDGRRVDTLAAAACGRAGCCATYAAAARRAGEGTRLDLLACKVGLPACKAQLPQALGGWLCSADVVHRMQRESFLGWSRQSSRHFPMYSHLFCCSLGALVG